MAFRGLLVVLLASRCTGNSVEDSNDASTTPFWQRVKDAVPKRLTTLTLGEQRDRMALWQRGIHQLPTNVDVGTYARHARLLPILRNRGGADCSEQGCDVGKVDYAALTRKLGPDFAEALRENDGLAPMQSASGRDAHAAASAQPWHHRVYVNERTAGPGARSAGASAAGSGARFGHRRSEGVHAPTRGTDR